MGKPIKMHESDSQPIPEKTGWSALATITTFDRGESSSQKWRKESAVMPKRVVDFTPPSLFVESMVEQLCKLFEKDPLSQKKIYKLICQKLHKMKLIDETYKVEEFQFMRSYYQKALYRLLTVSNSPAIDCKLEKLFNQVPSCLSMPPVINSSIFDWSRYQNDFEEIEFIARGGFGSVYRAKNKVDGCEYAVKKICLRYYDNEQFLRSLREVRTLAQLDHCNIVVYKAAWLEPLSGLVAGENCSSSCSGSKVSPDAEPSDEVPESSISGRESRDEVEDDSGNIVFANQNEDASEDSVGTELRYNPNKAVGHLFLDRKCDSIKRAGVPHNPTAGKVTMMNLPDHYRSLCDHSSGSSNKGCRGRKVPGSRCGGEIDCGVLHIQMQLCKESLRTWLDMRNAALAHDGGSGSCLGGESVVVALRIFQEILNGVEYMHSMGVVHHDLKPSNIFVEGIECIPLSDAKRAGSPKSARSPVSRSQVRVGDFGLACHLVQPPATLQDDDRQGDGEEGDAAVAVILADSGGHGSCLVQAGHPMRDEKEVIGTRLYAAPEQLNGDCNLMSDTYSLAIILFELLHPFFTKMERSKVISALRSSGNVPVEFKDSQPELASLIKDMLSDNPSNRPRMEKILEMLQSILPGHDRNMNVRSDSICSDDGISEKECIVKNRSRTNSFTQTYEKMEPYANFSHSWEEIFFEGDHVGDGGSRHCGNSTCHAVREWQDETISKLREENLRKDDIIEELKEQILQLKNSLKNLDEIQRKASH